MTRIQVACYCLLASAFTLTGLLLTQLGAITPRAQADMVVNRDNFTMMTARSSRTAESIFILDNINEKLLIYKTDIGRKSLEFARMLDLVAPAGAAGTTPTGRQGR